MPAIQPIDIFALIALMAVVTQLPRILPFVCLSNVTLPKGLTTWLSFVPASVILGMLAPQLCIIDGKLCLTSTNFFLLAALPSFLVSYATRNIFLTVLTGVSALAVIRLVL